ncbi:MAG: hypothetical protein OEY52_00740 [Gammaproteobacteria bacterium]|nr:hypothetical protein [Gammaproteobacteria bacterium]
MYIHQSQGSTESYIDWSVWVKRLALFAGLVILIKGVVWLTLPLLLIFFGISI